MSEEMRHVIFLYLDDCIRLKKKKNRCFKLDLLKIMNHNDFMARVTEVLTEFLGTVIHYIALM